ncbi:uncharacterized protein K460DRAFT_394210 [Cucurbitaria berberidis CBS 394.84]|uniref:Uncharacterized protein n=1 Tax=Cucurbitaria berberidis CBS 394.84 TaxID=1168544 RepID=A0A9P4LCP1_9PLEO|nr:uncharacterized protein K460DRAFT_394210 [Cucurbitaria berberidis CBS 394.84]KAF1849364.1 hypothetical protein K460DRAFT_394210 [Cucurbitaria berberidis CBS 394.84]
MSRPSTPFDGIALDSFIPSTDQQQLLSQAQLEGLFRSNEADQHLFSPNNNEVLHHLDSPFDNTSFTQFDSSNPSTISTPDFSTYSFGQISSAYLTPGQNSPQPYPLDIQQTHQANATPNIQDYRQRPLPIRGHTNTTFLRSAQPSPTYIRRRSLSHGDVDRLASAPPNPTFVRLQAPRVRSTTPEDTRVGPYAKHRRSASQGPGVRGRPLKPTSIPYVLSGGSFVGGMMSTRIGTPLDMLREPKSAAKLDQGSFSHKHYRSAHGLPMTLGDPIFEHMTQPDDLARSRQIIQIGAMAVVNRSTLDPRLEQENEPNKPECMLEKLQNVEQHLQEMNGDEAALKACTVIREALVQKTGNNEGVGKVEDDDEDDLEAPSKALSSAEYGLYNSAGDDSDLLAILAKENNRLDYSDGEDL